MGKYVENDDEWTRFFALFAQAAFLVYDSARAALYVCGVVENVL